MRPPVSHSSPSVDENWQPLGDGEGQRGHPHIFDDRVSFHRAIIGRSEPQFAAGPALRQRRRQRPSPSGPVCACVPQPARDHCQIRTSVLRSGRSQPCNSPPCPLYTFHFPPLAVTLRHSHRTHTCPTCTARRRKCGGRCQGVQVSPPSGTRAPRVLSEEKYSFLLRSSPK